MMNSQTMSLLQASGNPNQNSGIQLPSIPPIADGDVLMPEMVNLDTGSDIEPPNTQISTYVVQSDDNLSGIADIFGVSVDTIKQANHLTKNTISVGQSLIILPVSGVLYTVTAKDSLKGIASTYKVDISDILTYNNLLLSSVITVGEQLIIPHGKPSSTEVTTYLAKQKVPSYEPLLDAVWNWPIAPSGYYACPVPGARLTQGLHGHNAVDLAIAYGTPIHASAAGTVTVSKSNGLYNGGYGNFVMISHDNGSQTLYAHMSRTIVSPGQHVSQGQIVGYVGLTGLTTGPHVHFEIRGVQNPFVNPALCR